MSDCSRHRDCGCQPVGALRCFSGPYGNRLQVGRLRYGNHYPDRYRSVTPVSPTPIRYPGIYRYQPITRPSPNQIVHPDVAEPNLLPRHLSAPAQYPGFTRTKSATGASSVPAHRPGVFGRNPLPGVPGSRRTSASRHHEAKCRWPSTSHTRQTFYTSALHL